MQPLTNSSFVNTPSWFSSILSKISCVRRSGVSFGSMFVSEGPTMLNIACKKWQKLWQVTQTDKSACVTQPVGICFTKCRLPSIVYMAYFQALSNTLIITWQWRHRFQLPQWVSDSCKHSFLNRCFLTMSKSTILLIFLVILLRNQYGAIMCSDARLLRLFTLVNY